MPRSLLPLHVGAGRPWDLPAFSDTPRLFHRLRHEMNRLMEDVFGAGDGGEREEWFSPRMDIAETGKHYEITLDLPGMKAEDFSIELREGDLWITGERKLHREEEGKSFHSVECQYGQFRRVVPLREAVKEDQITAEYKDGVLRVTVPKDESVQPKKIEVKA